MPENVAPPAVIAGLIRRALASDPGNPALHLKLGFLHLDHHDHGQAASCFEAALGSGSDAPELPRLLARCYNYLGRPRDAIDVLREDSGPSFERGRALMTTGDAAAAEREFYALLALDPDDPFACRMLGRLLRNGGRVDELLSLFQALAGRGARNAQLLYNWGWALALAGERECALRLLFDPERVTAVELPVPAGFPDMAAFNDALAEEILGHPDRLSQFPVEDQANRGSSRVDNLFTGNRPQLIGLLVEAIQQAVSAYEPKPKDGFDPWPRARPAAARLRPWGLIQRRAEYEEGHIHAGGWLSGVYYVRIPTVIVTAPAAGPGCIQFGPPSQVETALPGAFPIKRYRPREGMLLLAPSHYQHHTIPSGVDEPRVSVAFDVVPDRDV